MPIQFYYCRLLCMLIHIFVILTFLRLYFFLDSTVVGLKLPALKFSFRVFSLHIFCKASEWLFSPMMPAVLFPVSC